MASLALALHAATAGPRHGSCQALMTLTRRASACHARFMCSAPAFCAWRCLPLVCSKLLIGVCVQDGLAASVCVYLSLMLLPLSIFLRVGASLLSLAGFMFKAARLGSFSVLFVVPSASCVRDGLASFLFCLLLCHTSTASVEPLPWGFRAVASPR